MRTAVPFLSSGNQFTFVLAWCSGRDFHDLFCLVILNPRRWLSPIRRERPAYFRRSHMTGLYYRSTARLRGCWAFLKLLHLTGDPLRLLCQSNAWSTHVSSSKIGIARNGALGMQSLVFRWPFCAWAALWHRRGFRGSYDIIYPQNH